EPYLFSSECLDEAKTLVEAVPVAERGTWNLCYVVLTTIKDAYVSTSVPCTEIKAEKPKTVVWLKSMPILKPASQRCGRTANLQRKISLLSQTISLRNGEGPLISF